jgi:hypothetical protein
VEEELKGFRKETDANFKVLDRHIMRTDVNLQTLEDRIEVLEKSEAKEQSKTMENKQYQQLIDRLGSIKDKLDMLLNNGDQRALPDLLSNRNHPV